jgi:hypothetical protein
MRTSQVPSTTWWRRAVTLVCLFLTLEAAPRARAECTAPPAPDARTLPLPPPGTCRLIPIGPQMVLEQDSTGRLTTAEEPAPKRSRGRNAATIILGALTAGAVLLLGRSEVTSRVGGRAGTR